MAVKIGNSVECIDLESFSSGGGEWKKVADLPARVAPCPVCLVLGGKLYCLGGFPTDYPSGRTGAMAAIRPWAMAYDPGVENWEPLPDPPHRPVFYPMFTAAVDGQWGPCIVVPWNRLLQIYHVDAKCWELRVFDCDHIFGFPLDGLMHENKCAGRAVAVEDKLYWLTTKEEKGADDGDDGCISRLHCLKVQVVTTDNTIPKTRVFRLEVSIIFRGAMLVDGNLGHKSSETSLPFKALIRSKECCQRVQPGPNSSGTEILPLMPNSLEWLTCIAYRNMIFTILLVMLLEMLIGRRAVNMSRPSGEPNLVEWALSALDPQEEAS
ncbi:hypothetical protein RHGRI_000913 [Rhododendron griersonianum]|uniref:Galactose oxidase/kelch repeat superfamily protein n=1 Tax=Rhododendron griersonianum TaxID=479676 RepID=A0AAV6LKW6_9ERIC|nr:hypothetical protein RHGRI_000913 [Rhododendron griersonianum]